MTEEQNGAPAADDGGLGASFVAHNSPSYGGDLGREFEAKNSVDPAHYDAAHHRIDRKAQRAGSRRKWYWLLGLLVLAAAVYLVHRSSVNSDNTKAPTTGGAAAGNGGQAQTGGAGGKGAQGPAAITVGQTRTGDIDIVYNALGTVTPVYTVTIYSQVTGRVMAVHYREGQLVHKGQSLVEIDPRPYQATLTQALGTLKRDQGVLAEAKIDLARYQAAFARNAIARQQLEDQQQTVEQTQGTVLSDQGTVDYDRVQLAYCHINAPITGRVGLRLVDPGNIIFSGTGSTLVVITQLQPITVVFNVSEDNLPQVQQQLRGGHPLQVEAYDRSDDRKLDTGRLGSLDNQIDTATGTLKFRANFNNPKDVLFPNQFVNARLRVKTLRNATLVPSAAVQHNGTAAFVYLVRPNNTVAVQPIKTLTSNELVTAAEGIGPNTTLATSGFDRLENGAAVQVRGGGGGGGGQPGQGKGVKTPGTSSGNTAP